MTAAVSSTPSAAHVAPPPAIDVATSASQENSSPSTPSAAAVPAGSPTLADATLGALVAQQAAPLDLQGQDLRQTDLKSLDLKGADLSGANLSGADLTGLDLSGANLDGADLSSANLTEPDRRHGQERGLQPG
jgi:hypothetical protein